MSITDSRRKRRSLHRVISFLIPGERRTRKELLKLISDWSNQSGTRAYESFSRTLESNGYEVNTSMDAYVAERVRDDQKAFNQLSTDALEHIVSEVRASAIRSNPLTYDPKQFRDFMENAPDPDEDAKNIASLYCVGVDICISMLGAVYLNEVRNNLPKFNRPDIYNMTTTEKHQAAAVIATAAYSRFIAETYVPHSAFDVTPKGTWDKPIEHMTPQFARVIVQNFRQQKVIAQFMEDHRVPAQGVNIEELRQYLNVPSSLRVGAL